MSQEKAFTLNLAETFPHLPAAPIVEAVIQWRARAGKQLPREELQEQLRQRLPDYPECSSQHQLQLEAEFGPEGASARTRRDTWSGFRLRTGDKRYVAQFTGDGITISRLAPYESWDVFSREAWRLWRIFIELAEPSEVHRLGVRFVNRIGIRHRDEVRACLTSPPECLEQVGLPAMEFLYQSRHDVPGYPFQVNVVRTLQNPAPAQSGEFGLIVDIDVATTTVLPCDDQVQEDRLRQMHWLKNKVFFNLMSADAIERFKKGKP